MKAKTIFVCSQCGNETAKWYGKCPACGEWNTLFEQAVEQSSAKSGKKGGRAPSAIPAEPKPIDELEETLAERIDTGSGELNTVLGGGLVKGSMVLIGGDPGIGKSTLLLQICPALCDGRQVLYVSGEESGSQIKMRARRLGVQSQNLSLLSHTDMEDIIEVIRKGQYEVVIIDSIQTMYSPELSAAPGSVSQVRECAMGLMQVAKSLGITILLVGHVTKDGAIAGPRVLEHMVDCVLYFEGERNLTYRILRAVKNRFGSTNEIGVFEMAGSGLKEVPNPSMVMLSGRPTNVSGTCVCCVMEGTRPILAEIQALVAPTSFGMPRRTCSGFDYNRAAMIVAVLEKRCGLNLGNQDIFINVTGGLRLNDPAADLAVALAIASNYRDVPLKDGLVAAGEIGLAGEIRTVSQAEKRVSEVEKLGFSQMILPAHAAVKASGDLELFKTKNVAQAIALLL